MFTPQQVDAFARGRGTVLRGDQSVPYRLTKVQHTRFEQAKALGYLDGRRPFALDNCWFSWCEAVGQLFAYLAAAKAWKGMKLVSMNADLICVDWDLSDEGMARVDQLWDAIHDAMVLAMPGCRLCIRLSDGPIFARMDPVPRDLAEKYMPELLTIMKTFRRALVGDAATG